MNNEKQEEKYQIIETIATGGMATIYKGVQISLNREVVIKKLHPHLSEDANFVKRFKREAALLGKLQHENIVGIFDFYEKEGDKFIVLEYIKGRSLKQIIKDKGKIPVKYALYILKEVLKGLSHVHKNNILHRDLKPDNIMISDEGVVKLTDFGLAFGSESVNVTNPGTYMGTPAYFPPEQLTGKQLSAVSDIFSLGITFAEILTGKNPFEGKDQFETINNILYFQSLNIDFNVDEVPQVVVDILKSMLNRDMSKRPKSGEELFSIISQFENPVTKDEFRQFMFDTQRVIDKTGIVIRVKKERRGLQATVLSLLFLILVFVVGFQIFTSTRSSVRTIYLPNNETKPFLYINSSPKSIQVKINDSIIVQTPQVISLDKGTFKLTTVSADYEKRDTTVELTANDTIFFEMKKIVVVEKWGFLSVNASPWADVYINDQLFDRTPIDENIKLKAGRYTLQLKHPNRKNYTAEIEIKKDSTLKLNVELEKAYGFFKIVVRPWADVYIDDQLVGTTPLNDSLVLLTGPHSIKLVNSKYPAIEDEITISEEEVLRKFYSF
ncbi:MAG: serine/threonine-protein kinase [bacterium]